MSLYPSPSASELLKAVQKQGARLESTAQGNVDQVRQYLCAGGISQQLDRFNSLLIGNARLSDSGRNELLSGAEEALASALTGKQLSTRGRVGLEALICLTGRPAIPTHDGNIDLKHPIVADWADRLVSFVYDGTLASRIRGVGRIDSDGEHIGTGFVVGHDLVLTNRHVLQSIATATPRRERPDKWVLHEEPITIDFSDEPDPTDESRRFRITEVLGWGEHEIIDKVTPLSYLDAALLRVDRGREPSVFPKPLPLNRDHRSGERHRAVVAIGYPAPPSSFPRDAAGEFDIEILDRLKQLFPVYRRKHVSPGFVTNQATGVKTDENYWTLCYDATTLTGSSGSSLIGLEGDAGVVGLHFGGIWRKENYAHATAWLKDVEFLRGEEVIWI